MKALQRKTLLTIVAILLLLLSLFGVTMLKSNAAEPITTPLFSVTGGNSSLRYGKHKTYAQDKEGLIVSLSQGDKFHVNKAIDLSDKTARDNVISLFPTPSILGTSDAHFLSITFTDAHDPENFITVTAWDPWQDNWGAEHCYIYTYAAGRNTAGLAYTGEEKIIQKNNTFGTEALVSFSGQGTKVVGKQEIFLAFDYQQRQLYATGFTSPRVMVADYDDTDFYDELWYGFTTGEVFISIEAGNFKNAAFNFMITEIADIDLTAERFTPDKKPSIEVDLSAFGGKKPQAIVGERMPFFPCKAESIYDKALQVSTEVYKGGEKIAAEEGFIPQTVGEYVVKYVATDKYGNSVEQSVAVDAVERKGDLSLVLFGNKTEFLAGKTSRLAKYYQFSGNAVGRVNLKITANLIGGDIRYEIDPETLQFTPQAVGSYVICYEYSDYIGSHKKIELVNVIKNDEVFLYSQSILPDYFIKGAKYLLREGGGCTFKNGFLEEVKAQIFVTENGETRELDGNTYEVRGDGEVIVTYKVDNGINSESYSKKVKVVDVGYSQERKIEKYFDTLAGEVVGDANEERVFFNFAKSGEIRFINDIQGVSFYTQFSVDKRTIGGVNVFLTDSENPEEKIKFTYTMRDGKTQFFVNDGATYNISAYNLAKKEKAELTYDNDTCSVRVSKTQNIKIKETVKGKPFNGFTSSKVKVSYALFGVEEQTQLSIYKINNQPLYDISSDGDMIRPEVIASHMRGERKLGETVTLAPLVIGDVLDPYVECTINVTDPDGETVVDNNGVRLSKITDYTATYSFTLTKMGEYTTRYVIEDGAGNRSPNTAKNTAVDKEAPNLLLQGTPVKNATVGERVNIPKASAEDSNHKGEKTACKVYIWLENPDGKVENISDKDAFIPKTAGKYTINYYTVDESGNSAMQIYYIAVMEK